MSANQSKRFPFSIYLRKHVLNIINLLLLFPTKLYFVVYKYYTLKKTIIYIFVLYLLSALYDTKKLLQSVKKQNFGNYGQNGGLLIEKRSNSTKKWKGWQL